MLVNFNSLFLGREERKSDQQIISQRFETLHDCVKPLKFIILGFLIGTNTEMGGGEIFPSPSSLLVS